MNTVTKKAEWLILKRAYIELEKKCLAQQQKLERQDELLRFKKDNYNSATLLAMIQSAIQKNPSMVDIIALLKMGFSELNDNEDPTHLIRFIRARIIQIANSDQEEQLRNCTIRSMERAVSDLESLSKLDDMTGWVY